MKTVSAPEWRRQLGGTSFLLISVQGSEMDCGFQDVGRGLCRLCDHLVSASGGEGAEWSGGQEQNYSLNGDSSVGVIAGAGAVRTGECQLPLQEGYPASTSALTTWKEGSEKQMQRR